jgi:hypothetical protein
MCGERVDHLRQSQLDQDKVVDHEYVRERSSPDLSSIPPVLRIVL